MKRIRALAFGRLAEVLANLTEDEKRRTAVDYSEHRGSGPMDPTGPLVQVWNCRKAMARTVRMQEQGSPVARWRPVMPLTDGEGY